MMPLPRLSLLALALPALAAGAFAQGDAVAVYRFDFGSLTESNGQSNEDLIPQGAPLRDDATACGLGEEGTTGGLRLNGDDQYLLVPPVSRTSSLIGNSNFALAFAFHPQSSAPRQTLFRKAADCSAGSAEPQFLVEYLATGDTRQLEVVLAEDDVRRLTQTVDLPADRYWHQVVIQYESNTLLVTVDEEAPVSTQIGGTRLRFTNNFNLEIGNASCPSTTNFGGVIDEIRVYAGSLTRDEAASQFRAVDEIADPATTLINLGDQLDLTVANTCAVSFAWSPAESIVGPADGPTVTVAPTVTTTYTVLLTFADGSTATSEVRIQVFDPANFDCDEVLVPEAFTPDGSGPVQNEGLGISNAASFLDFEAFEVYDRWGNRVFAAPTATARWDGSYEGEPAMPGVYLWRVAYTCNEEAFSKTGSTVLIR